MAKKLKKIIRATFMDLSPYDLEGSLHSIKEQLEGWIETYGPNARLEWDPDYWPQYSDSPSPRYNIAIERPETDEEFEKRIATEAANQKAQDERDLKEFKRLKKKFEGK